MSPLDPLYYVNVGPHGTFKPSGDLHTQPDDIDNLFAHLEANQVPKLTLHFHGGLVKEESGLQVAESMIPLYLSAGSHPVCFIWETGLVETLTRNLTTIYKTRLAQTFLKYVLRETSKRLGVSPAGKGPGEGMSLAEIDSELAKEAPFEAFEGQARGTAEAMNADELDALQAEIEEELEEDLLLDDEIEVLLEDEAPQTELLDQETVGEVQAEEAKGFAISSVLAKILASISVRVIKRYYDKRDHGLFETVFEELLRELYISDLGKWVWEGMKDTAKEMWAPNSWPISEDSYAGGYFLDKLVAHKAANPNFVVDLVGHSAGSIVICHMLAAAALGHPGFEVRNIILLAPGCSTDLLYDEIVTKPERYQDFRMFTMHDDYERKDALVPLIYPRSLLYFVSGALEEEAGAPLAGLERHLRGEKPYDSNRLKAIKAFMYAPGKERIVLSVTGPAEPGLISAAVAHGNFNSDRPTRVSIKYIIRN